MGTIARLRGADPFRADSVIRNAAGAARRTGKPKHVAYALDVTAPRVRQIMAGDDSGAFTRTLGVFESLARDSHTTAIPLLMECWALCQEVQVADRTCAELRERLEQLTQIEPHRDADEELATLRATAEQTPEALEDAADADVLEVECQIERAAIRREIATRMRKGTWVLR